MKITPFIPFLTLYEKNMPFYMSTIGVSQKGVYRPSGINDCQLLYVVSGNGEAIINNTTYPLKKNSLLFLPPNTPHNYFPTEMIWKTKYITFSGSGSSDFKALPAFVQSKASTFDFLRWYKLLYNYKYTPNHENSLSITLYAMLLEFKSSIALNSPAFKEKKNILISAIHEMANDYDLSLSDIAEKMSISEEHFCRSFKAHTGVRPLEYLNFIKIQRAKELLQNTDADIAEVAKMSGYSSPSYFTMLFKRYTGTTPKNFRNS